MEWLVQQAHDCGHISHLHVKMRNAAFHNTHPAFEPWDSQFLHEPFLTKQQEV